jgi:hypothetical protein
MASATLARYLLGIALNGSRKRARSVQRAAPNYSTDTVWRYDLPG